MVRARGASAQGRVRVRGREAARDIRAAATGDVGGFAAVAVAVADPRLPVPVRWAWTARACVLRNSSPR